MQSKRKSNGIIGHSFDEKENSLAFMVGESTFSVGIESFCDGQFATLPVNAKAALLHGLVQKISDRAAIGRDPETGASASPEEKFAAMKECADRLMAGGPWNAGSTGAPSAGGLLYRAMRNLYPKAWSDKTSLSAYIAEKALSESERLKKKVTENDVRAGLSKVKRIAAEMEKIRRAEMPDVGVNANDMLQELETKA